MDGVLRLTRILLVAPATFRWGGLAPAPDLPLAAIIAPSSLKSNKSLSFVVERWKVVVLRS
jgi:hypothetical protein